MRKSYHFIGIGGIGMSGLAQLLLSQNIKVSGSDLVINPLIERLIQQGAHIHQGHAAENVPSDAAVVFTSDVKPDNPELLAAQRLNSPLLHRADLLAELLEDKKSLAVAGTHGKTTTSSLLSTVLFDAGVDPSFAVGGKLPAFQSNARYGQGELFAFECDESDRSFLKFHPFGAIVTNIDDDHLINYEGSFALLVKNFQLFISQVQSIDHLIWCRDDPHLSTFCKSGQSYGFHPSSDWRITASRQAGFGMLFDLEHRGILYPQIELSLIGNHNVSNAAAVFALAMINAVPESSIRQSFKNFKGVLRRCEDKGIYQGIQFIDDYAHHPTEIEVTLRAIRQAIGTKKLIAVFQPHRYSRTKDCLGSYGKIFDSVDALVLTDIYGAGEEPIPEISHRLIQQEVERASSISSHYVPRKELSCFLMKFATSGDVVVTLGAGDITQLSKETAEIRV